MGQRESIRAAVPAGSWAAWSKRTALGLLYRTGGLAAHHTRVNGRCLTVVSFHRVLPETDELWRTAHPTWTVSTKFFDQCLDFFAQHYSTVTLRHVLGAVSGERSLPNCALLITFDDGWADNEQHALPLLRKRRMPAALFAVAECVQTGRFWQERIFRGWEEGQVSASDCDALLRSLSGGKGTARLSGQDLVLALITRLGSCNATERERLIARVYPRENVWRQDEMLTAMQLRNMRAGGVSIGSHGLTHNPVTMMDNPMQELCGSRDFLEHELSEVITSFSFPHGSYNEQVLRAAASAGYKALFTSDPCLNTLVEGRTLPARLGRLPIIAAEVSDASGRFRADLMARWLFLRPRRCLDAEL